MHQGRQPRRAGARHRAVGPRARPGAPGDPRRDRTQIHRPRLTRSLPIRPLLAVCTLPPWPIRDGYSLRVANLLRGLSATWSITLVSPGAMPGCAHLPVALDGPGLAYPWRFDPARLASAIRRALADHPSRVLLWPGAEAAWLAQAGPPPAVMDMVDCNPLELWRGIVARAPARDRLRDLRQMVPALGHARRIVRATSATVCAGERDTAWMTRIGGRNTVRTVPNGVDPPPSDSLPPESARPTVAFTGTLDFAPNVDAAGFLVERIWPLVRRARPDARLVLAGRRPADAIARLHGTDGIDVQADVPDLAQVLGEAWVAVAPMRTGAGIKNKVLEAWACARPVVMTPIATNGLSLPPGHAALVAPDAARLAAAIVGLLHDASARSSLGEAARRHAERHFGWGAAVARFDTILDQASV